MKRLSVDFNTLNSTPIDKLKLGHEGTPGGDCLSGLTPGERVIFFDSEIQVEGTVEYVMLRDHHAARPPCCATTATGWVCWIGRR